MPSTRPLYSSDAAICTTVMLVTMNEVCESPASIAKRSDSDSHGDSAKPITDSARPRTARTSIFSWLIRPPKPMTTNDPANAPTPMASVSAPSASAPWLSTSLANVGIRAAHVPIVATTTSPLRSRLRSTGSRNA